MKTKKKAKHQRAKLALLPILLGVLGYILLTPVSPQEEVAQASLATLPAAEHAVAPQTAQAAPLDRASTWPDVDLKFLSQANPLASRERSAGPIATERFTSIGADVRNISTLQPAVDALVHVAQNLSGSQVNYVFESNRRKTIMLGDQMFEQGAQIGDSVRLHDIQNDALILMESSPSLPGTAWLNQFHELASGVGRVLRNATVRLSPVAGLGNID